MLESVKIMSRQSEIRSANAELAAIGAPSDEQIAKMDELTREYRSNETRYRAALVAEDEERRAADYELETRDVSEWSKLIDEFEVRQAVAALTEDGAQLTGATAEVVTELRSQGVYQGVPVPLEALEVRNTIAADLPNQVQIRPIIDRLFPQSVAARMGTNMISVPSGEVEYPITTAGATVGWQSTEGGTVGAATPYTTANRSLKSDNTLSVQMRLSRKSMKQTAGIEQAIRRDMQSAIAVGLDRAVFLGAGASGEPLGVIAGASTYGIVETAVSAAATWDAFREAVVRFMTENAVSGPGAVRLLIRPETWSALDGAVFDTGSGMTEWDRLTKAIPTSQIAVSPNALEAPAGSPAEASALLTTATNGQSPIFMATWGAVDMIRDPYTDAQSGGVRITALVTTDVTISRAEQLQVLTGLQ